MSNNLSHLRRSAKTYSKSEVADISVDNTEVIKRSGYSELHIQHQVGFELPNMQQLVSDFITTDRSLETSMPLGWFVTFFGKEEDRSTEWQAENIEDIRVYELNLSIFDSRTNAPIAIGNNWMRTLIGAKGVLDLGPTTVARPVPVQIIQYEGGGPSYYPLNRFESVINSMDVKVESWPRHAEVIDILGYRPNLRTAYIDYNTIFQMHLAYGVDSNNQNLKFIFSGAEINYAEMVNPRLQVERFTDWGRPFRTLDTSICSTLKIELLSKRNLLPAEISAVEAAVAEAEAEAGTIEEVDEEIARIRAAAVRYTSGNLYPGTFEHDRNILEDELSLPGVFLLPSCRRFWETVNQIRSVRGLNGDLFIDDKLDIDDNNKKDEILKRKDMKDKELNEFYRFKGAINVHSVRRLVEDRIPINF
ncbi:MAG: hypothetical protein AB8H12_21860 [Lewinella sp.]